MENASKALLIAGAMLLTILLSTLAIYVFNIFGEQTSRLYDKLEESDIDSFNQQFFQYENRNITQDEDGKWHGALKIQDVVSIINFAKDNNSTNEIPVKVKVNSSDLGNDLQNKTADELNVMLYNNMDNNYKCTTTIPNGSRLVEEIFIEKLN